MSLFDFLRMLTEGWRWLVGAIVLGAIVGVGYLAVTPPEFEATGLVEVIGTIEPPERAVERIRLPGFQDAILNSLGWSNDDRARLYRSSLRASPRGTGVIRLELRAFNRNEAQQAMSATVERFSRAQGPVARAAAEKLRRELAIVRDEMQETRGYLEKLSRISKEIPSSDQRNTLMLLNMVDAAKTKLHNLRRVEGEMEEQLGLPTGETASLSDPKRAVAGEAPIVVSEMPVSPRQMLTMIFSIVGGLVFGAVFVMLRHALRLAPARES